MVPGQYTFTLKVTDTNGLTSRKPMTWNVTQAGAQLHHFPLSGTTLVYNQPYTQTLLGLGGTLPYTWTPLQSDARWAHDQFSTGVISGTPAFTGTQTVTDGAPGQRRRRT